MVLAVLIQKDFDMCGNCYYRKTILELAETLQGSNQALRVGSCAVVIEHLKKLDTEALLEQETYPQRLIHTS